MKKAAAQLCLIWKGILFIGFSVQIVLGLVWMCANFADVQRFAPAVEGIYPLLAGVFGKVPQALCLLQLGAAGAVGYRLVRPICPHRFFWRVWYVLALLTFPMAMQCHLALLPYSFVGSLLLLELSFCREAVRVKKKLDAVCLARAGVCWIAMACLLPEYGWLGGLAPLMAVAVRIPAMRRDGRRLVYSLAIVAAFGGMIAGAGSLVERDEESPRTFWSAMACRTAWPTLWNDSRQWPEELQRITEEVRWDACNRSGNMERLLQPAVEGAVGAEQAQKYYREMAGLAWRLHRTQIIKQILWDAAVYIVPPAILQMQLTGRGYDSYSGRNYEIMSMRHPLITRTYLDYSCWWFAVFLGVTALLAVTRGRSGLKIAPGDSLDFLAVWAVCVGGILCFYIMRGAGIADYKCSIAATELWTLWALYCMGSEQSNETEMSDDGKTA